MGHAINGQTPFDQPLPSHPAGASLTGRIFFTLLLLALVSAVPAFAAPTINPGDWEYSMKMKIEGLGIPIPQIPVTFTGCITEKNPTVETPEMKKAGCKIVNQKISGNNVTYTGRCVTGDSVTDTNYKMNFQGNSMTGTFDQVRKVSGKVQSTATGTINAKRLGPCTKPAK
ncbi:MAG: DUF3617 family protein [Sulfuricaulis sp.]|uniref:DUF3617 domain-containing protein n=1 Tax=Sulfuricaulis sp. TaxID=2003553 RepID=UPI0034A3B3E9